MYNPTLFAVIVAAALLATAAPTHAIFIETPLIVEPAEEQADVGDDLDGTIAPSPNNASAQDHWAGKEVKLRYSYDKHEGQAGGPDDAVSDEGHTEGDIATIRLDDQARGTFTWVIPDEVDDRNVLLFLEDDAGERLAFAHLSIGDAEPQMHIMNGPADGEPEIDEDQATPEDEDDATEEAAAFGLFALLGALGVAGLALSVLRRR